MEYMEAVKKIARVMSTPKEIDWEQRRYEIAKSVYPVVANDCVADKAAGLAVHYADALIEELKKPKRQ